MVVPTAVAHQPNRVRIRVFECPQSRANRRLCHWQLASSRKCHENFGHGHETRRMFGAANESNCEPNRERIGANHRTEKWPKLGKERRNCDNGIGQISPVFNNWLNICNSLSHCNGNIVANLTRFIFFC